MALSIAGSGEQLFSCKMSPAEGMILNVTFFSYKWQIPLTYRTDKANADIDLIWMKGDNGKDGRHVLTLWPSG